MVTVRVRGLHSLEPVCLFIHFLFKVICLTTALLSEELLSES